MLTSLERDRCFTVITVEIATDCRSVARELLLALVLAPIENRSR